MKKLALLGASGHGKVVADIAEELGWGEVVFFDDAWPSLNANTHWPVVGDTADLLRSIQEYDGVLVTIGDCATRWTKYQELQQAGAALVSLIHPKSVVSKYAAIGNGSVVMAGSIINADVVIGDACIINTGATVDHDCRLGNGVHISPGVHLSGNVSIGNCTWVGVGSTVRHGIEIGSSALIGAGSVVVANIHDGALAFGNPARIQSTAKILP
jgi:sugar O-acyltransferase (sialic acid O-acetyltransferase NeuD family)